ncbi:hypothetical protein J4D99_05200 [Siccationidurans ginsengisoli]|uniref:hypothetical protein n=1 Tax=unclassified Hymenobacter TaxID=2615202 RepID=UPI001AADC924|nr:MULTISPECIES: hypothetical protein [unclassified Hymenobacter]MBO2030781.1 hypothetical protein [Hymenobacter sp. BT559]
MPVIFYAVCGVGIVGSCAAYAALVLYSASWPEAAALRTFYAWEPRAYTAAEFAALRGALAGLALAALGLATGLGLALAGREQLRRLGQEIASSARGLAAGWRGLARRQRCWAGGLLLALTALRLYYSTVIIPADDGVSYEVFVRARLLVVSAAYPMPNNHIGSNTLNWLFYQLHPGFWWSMRLPVMLTSTAATVLWFLTLLRRSSFRVAVLAVSLFSVLQLSLFHAASGRGYWLLLGLGAVGFFAVLELTAQAAGRAPRVRAAWLGLGLSGVLGLYTVPTHGYFLFSAYGWLGLVALRRRAWPLLVAAVALGGLTLLGAGLLYAPLLLVSGPGLLFHNNYVLPLATGAFWRQLPVYLWLNEGWLSGHRWLGVLPLLAVLLGTGAWWRRAQAGLLPRDQAQLGQLLVPLSVWFITTPYVLLLVQRVAAPERTLFYKALPACVLVALLADWVLRVAQSRGRARALRALLVGGGLVFTASQLYLVERHNAEQKQFWQMLRQPMAWLATQPVGPVLAPEPLPQFILCFFAHTEFRSQPWVIDSRPRPGVRYRYVVSPPGVRQVPGGPPVRGVPAFHGAADIFVVQ